MRQFSFKYICVYIDAISVELKLNVYTIGWRTEKPVDRATTKCANKKS